jgi:adenylate cyclase
MIEIERKFLVLTDAFKKEAFLRNKLNKAICPRYLNELYVMNQQDKAFLTIKGITNDNGLSRFEWGK